MPNSTWNIALTARSGFRFPTGAILHRIALLSVSYRREDWKNEVPWMSLYFTFGVLSSIWLVHASQGIEQSN